MQYFDAFVVGVMGLSGFYVAWRWFSEMNYFRAGCFHKSLPSGSQSEREIYALRLGDDPY